MPDDLDISAETDMVRGRAFWSTLGYAILLGLVGVLSGLVFLGITGHGEDWYGNPGIGWFDGPLWWVAVAAGAGLVVGLLRRVFGMPSHIPGLIEDLRSEKINVRQVPSIVAVSAVSLLGGASLGPEVALGQMGGGFATWLAKRRNLDDDSTKALTLSGMAGAFGGLFSSPLLAMLLVLEIARPPLRYFQRVFYGSLVASSVSFGLYFVIVGSLFLGIYEVPTYEFEDWHLLAGIGLGLLAGLAAILTGLITQAAAKAFERLPTPALVKPVVGGIIFGLIGVVVPLTLFTGSEQLETLLANASTFGGWLLLAILIGKMLAFAASTGSGFMGGPIFPILFIGGASGVFVNHLFPAIPLGLAFTCMLAAVPGSIVPAPFTMVLLAGLLTQIGTLQTAPILMAVGAAYLVVAAVQSMRALRTAKATDGAMPGHSRSPG